MRGSFVWPAASVVFWWQKTNVSPASSRSRASSTRPRRSATGSSVSGASTGSSPSARPSPRRNAESAAKAPVTPCRSRKLGTGRGRPNHLSVITLNRSPSRRRITSRVHSSQALAVRLGFRQRRGCGRSSGCQVAEEGVGVGDPLVARRRRCRSTASPRQTCASENVSPSTSIPSQRLDEPPGLVRVALGVGPAGQPPAVVAPLGRPQRRVGEDVLGAHLLPAPERLEDRAPGKLVGPVAEHRPVRDLARRRAPRADRVEQPARAASGQRVEVRRRRGLVPGAPAEQPRAPGRRARRAGRRRWDSTARRLSAPCIRRGLTGAA